jgi:hypothetical protein
MLSEIVRSLHGNLLSNVTVKEAEMAIILQLFMDNFLIISPPLNHLVSSAVSYPLISLEFLMHVLQILVHK